MSQTAVRSEGIWFIDNLVHLRVRGEETHGGLAIVELEGARGHMPPLHIHHNEDESFVVLDGNIMLYVGDAVLPLSTGAAALGPRGVPHTFRVESETARWLAICAPAGFERFVSAIGEPALENVLPPTPVAPRPERLAEVAREFGIEVLGPPGTLPS